MMIASKYGRYDSFVVRAEAAELLLCTSKNCRLFLSLALRISGWSGWGDQPESDENENLDSDLAWHGLSRTVEDKRCYQVMEEPNLSKIIDKLISHHNFG